MIETDKCFSFITDFRLKHSMKIRSELIEKLESTYTLEQRALKNTYLRLRNKGIQKRDLTESNKAWEKLASTHTPLQNKINEKLKSTHEKASNLSIKSRANLEKKFEKIGNRYGKKDDLGRVKELELSNKKTLEFLKLRRRYENIGGNFDGSQLNKK